MKRINLIHWDPKVTFKYLLGCSENNQVDQVNKTVQDKENWKP
jgi:hypothetical protein